MQRDGLIDETPFFDDGHARLAASVANFAAREVEPFAREEEGPNADAHFPRARSRCSRRRTC